MFAQGSFINAAGTTPEELARKREIIMRMLPEFGKARYVGEGLGQLFQGIASGRQMYGLEDQQNAGTKDAMDAYSKFTSGLAKGGKAQPGSFSILGQMPVDTSSADTAPVGSGEVQDYIKQAAIQRGIDPEIALKVAAHEGGFKDPVQQSLYQKNGHREPSYGPFQLLVGGGDTGYGTGLGNAFMEQTGLDPRDPANWQKGVDFALDQAKKGGWGPWYGAKAAGITGKMGISDAQAIAMADQQQPASIAAQPGMAATASPALGYADGAKMDAPMMTYDQNGSRMVTPSRAPMPGAPYKGPGAQMVTMAQNAPKGLIAPGNIDLTKRPVVKNADGTISTVRSMSFNEDGREILVPTVSPDGRILSDKEAIDLYHRTGQHLGMFDNPDDATSYAQNLHNQQAEMYKQAPPLPAPTEVASLPVKTVSDAPQADPGVQMAQSGGLSDDQLMQGISIMNNAFLPPEAKAQAQFVVEQELARRQAMQEQQFKQADPEYQLGLRKTQLELQRLENPQMVHTLSPEEAKALHLDPNNAYQQKPDGSISQIGGGGVRVDARQMGTIPPGYKANYDENGNILSLEPIPGGKEANDAANAEKQKTALNNSKETFSDIITSAGNRARDAFNNKGGILPTGGLMGAAASMLPSSNAAEVRRQIEVLKSNAKVENLNAMRQQSPTGGALGAVSDSESKMLAAKVGTLDPESPYFVRDLNDYERALLRVVHGPEAGDKIFEQSLNQGSDGDQPAAASQAPEGVEQEVWDAMTPEERKLWQH